MVWQSSAEGHEDLFQGSFASNNTIWLEVFVTVQDENSLGWTWWQPGINIRYRRERRCDDLVVVMLWLLGHFYYLQKSLFCSWKMEFDRLAIFR